jgi:hypothetical protein
MFLLSLFLLNLVNGQNFQAALDLHNYYRDRHCVQNLTWNRGIANLAQQYATTLAVNGTFVHGMLYTEDNSRVGQNLAAFTSSNAPLSDLPSVATQLWYNEVNKYNWSMPGSRPETGHFTQLVWKDTVYLGMGMHTHNRRTVVVANYYSPGNVVGRFRANVLSPDMCIKEIEPPPATPTVSSQTVIPIVEQSATVNKGSGTLPVLNVTVSSTTSYIYLPKSRAAKGLLIFVGAMCVIGGIILGVSGTLGQQCVRR